ncbi:MAG TPA: DUF885 domain-containing protein [Anaeromyxobacter sp.]
MRSSLLVLAAAIGAGCATRGPASPPAPASSVAPSPPGPRGAVRALEEEYLRERFRRFPEMATRFGWPGADHAAVSDPRPQAVAEWQRVEDALLARAKAVDARAAEGTPEAVELGILLEALEGARAARPCRSELWNVSSIGGWQAQYAGVAETQPVGTPALNEAAKARLRGLAVRIDREIEALREGVRLGYVATRENVDRATGELDKLLATPPRDWPYTRPGARAGDPALLDDLAGIVAREVLPAARRYRDYLAKEYEEHARATPSLLALPDGEACYAGAIRRSSTLALDPRAVHDTGRARLAAIHAEIREIARRRFGWTDPAPAVLRRLREDPALRFRSKEEIVDVSRAAIDRAAAAAPRAFGHVPQAPVRVREYPEFRRAGNPAESYSPDFSTGKLAGIYFINVFDPEKKPRAPVESTAFHEAIPGHHFQIALALERGESRLGKYVINSGFVEGWALYAERLADELGLFSDDVYRLGMLSSEAFRASRLVVDTGLAVLGWPRQRAIDFLVENAGLDAGFAASEVDRYAAWPGQATSYMLGQLEIRRLRAEAEQALGPRFDLRAFHDAVLENGAVPLGVLRDRIERFVRERRGTAGQGGR